MITKNSSSIKNLAAVVLLAIAILIGCTQIVNAEVVTFPEIPPQGSGTGGGRSELAPRGFGVELDGQYYWLESEYDNSNFCAVYTGETNGYDKPLPVYDANNELITYTFYAYIDRNPESANGFIALYKDDENVDLSGKLGTPERASEVLDPSGQPYRWRIPITLTLEEGCRYEFAFLRGIKAHNGVTGVIDQDGTGYLKEPEGTEMDWYEQHKNDEYLYREYKYSTYIPTEDVPEKPYIGVDTSDPNPDEGEFRSMRFRFTTSGDVDPDSMPGSEYKGEQGNACKLTMLSPSASKIQTVRETDASITNKILSTQKHTEEIQFGFTLSDLAGNADEGFLKTETMSSISVMDRNRKKTIASSSDGSLTYKTYNAADNNKVTIAVAKNTLEENKWYSLVFDAGLKSSANSGEVGQDIIFYFKTRDLSSSTGVSVNVELSENSTDLKSAIDKYLGEGETYENVGALTVSSIGSGNVTAEDCDFIKNNLINLTELNFEAATFADNIIPDSAFSGMARLTEFVFPEKLEKIGISAFESCKALKEINLPYSIKTIGDRAFYNCSALSGTLTMSSAKAPVISENTFTGTNFNKVMLPNGSYTSYHNAPYWPEMPIRERKADFTFNISKHDGSPAADAEVLLRETQSSGAADRKEYSADADANGTAKISNLADGKFIAYIQCGDYAVSSVDIEAKGQTWEYNIKLAEKRAFSVTLPTDGASLKEALEAEFTENEGIAAVSSLKVITEGSYELSADDLAYLGYNNGYTSLESLDLTDAKIAGGKFPGGTEKDPAPFSSMTKLNTVKLGADVNEIGDYAFAECGALENIVIAQPSQLNKVGSYAFYLCELLPDLEFLPKQKIVFGESAFEGCSAIESVEIPAAWTELSGGMFRNCVSLSDVIFANDSQLNSIGNSCFESCKALSSVKLPASVETIGNSAFKKSGLAEFDFSGLTKVTAVPTEMFSQCTALQKVQLREGITSVGSEVFYRTSIKEITIPKSLKKIGGGMFAYCDKLESVNILGSSVDVGEGAFRSTGLKDIPKNLKPDWTSGSVFAGCNNLGKITLPAGMTKIPAYTFQNCTGKYFEVDLNGIKIVEKNAFEGSSAKISIIPASINELQDSAFKRCTGMGNAGILYVEAEKPPVLGTTVFRNTGLTKIAVPHESYTAYKNADGWNNLDFDGIALANKEQISLDKTEMTITAGDSFKLTAAVIPEGYVIWTSSNSDVAKVSADGTVTGLKAGTAVITAATKGEGKTATCSVTVKKLPAPTATAVSAGYNQIKVSWNGVTGAAGYEVYRATSKDGFYEKMIALGSGDRSFLDKKDVTTGKTYYYKVLAYKKAGEIICRGEESAIVSAKPVLSKVTGLTATRTSKYYVKTKWKGVSGETGYQIYRSTSKTGTYSKVGSVKMSTYSYPYLSMKTTSYRTYYYKVRAYKYLGDGKYTYGAFSDIAVAKPSLSAPTKLSVSKYSRSYVKVKWKGVSGETGYQVYRATSKYGKYTKVASVKMSTYSYPYAKIKTTRNRTYYYKVRAYKYMGDGKYAYGSYSYVKSYKLR